MNARDVFPASVHWLSVDRPVAEFEAAYAKSGSADPLDFCPPPDSPLYPAVAAELIRADLEFAARAGRRPRLADYAGRFPALFADPAALGPVAFEEYRLRAAAGEAVDPDDYRTRFGVDPSDWATASVGQSVRPRWGPSGSAVKRLGATRILAELPADARKDAERLGLDAGRFPDPGAEVAGFRLVGELGRGAFARVYLAEQADLAGRFVALKLSTKLVAEAQTLARLQHTNIVPVYSVHRAGRFHAVCMPFLGAVTLADALGRLRRHDSMPVTADGLLSTLAERKPGSTVPGDRPADTPLPAVAPVPAGPLAGLRARSHVGAVLWIGAELADGLAHAHDRGVVHRDVKPANVLLADDGRPMLLDFNLAGDEKRTDTDGAVGGTPSHMSPEQLAAMAGGSATIDARTDVYSLGLILFELLTGRPPHPAPGGPFGEQIAALRQARSAPPPRARSFNPAVTPAVDAILATCLAAAPADRYPSARHLADDLRRHLDDLPLAHAREPSVRERLRKKLRRNPWAKSVPFLAALFAAVAGLGAAGYAYRGWQLEAADAVESYRAFREEASAARFKLYAPDPDPRQRQAGADLAAAALARFGLPDAADWQAHPRFARLDPDAQTAARAAAGELLVHLARADVLRWEEVPADQRPALLESAGRWCELAEQVYPDDAGKRVPRWYAGELRELAAGHRSADAPRAGTDAPLDDHMRAGDLIARRRYRDALAVLRAADRLAAKEPVYWHALGRCQAELGDLPAAVASFTAGVALQSDQTDVFYLNRGNARLLAREYADAVADFDAAVRLRPDDPLLLRDRSLARLGAGDYPGALADLARAEDLDPGHTRVWFMRSRVHARAGDKAAAAKAAAEGLKRTPADELSWVARAQARRPRDPAGAVADLDEALALRPRSKHALQTKASVLAEDLNRPADAVAVLDQLVEWHPDYVNARAGRGVVHARLGNRAAAHADAAAALELDAGPFTRYQMAGVFALTSKAHPADRAEALRLLASALRDKEGLALVSADRDLDPVRSAPGFGKLVDAAKTLESASHK